MAFDENLADRTRQTLNRLQATFQEKRMFGGLCFMVDDKMCVCIDGSRLMARVGPEAYEAALTQPGCGEMKFTGRPLKGFVFVEPDALESDTALRQWVQQCLDYNPFAPQSKQARKKK